MPRGVLSILCIVEQSRPTPRASSIYANVATCIHVDTRARVYPIPLLLASLREPGRTHPRSWQAPTLPPTSFRALWGCKCIPAMTAVYSLGMTDELQQPAFLLPCTRVYRTFQLHAATEPVSFYLFTPLLPPFFHLSRLPSVSYYVFAASNQTSRCAQGATRPKRGSVLRTRRGDREGASERE